jgi:ubiquinone/menaquinone biosynthesis C-methylase UbiE
MPLAGVPDFDRVADRYDATRTLPGHVMDRILEEIKLHFPRGPRTIDAGCGTGRFLVPMQRAGWNTWGLDVSDKMLRKAQENGARDLVRADLRRIPLPDKRFDSALVIQVLHLLPEPMEVVREICRVCRVGLMAVAVGGDGPNIHDEYREMMTARGLQPTPPSRTALDVLKAIASKKFVNEAARWESESDADREIAKLEERLYSFQWKVADESHQEIIARLRERHAGRVYYRTKRAHVGVWNVRDLEASMAHDAGEWPIRPPAA